MMKSRTGWLAPLILLGVTILPIGLAEAGTVGSTFQLSAGSSTNAGGYVLGSANGNFDALWGDNSSGINYFERLNSSGTVLSTITGLQSPLSGADKLGDIAYQNVVSGHYLYLSVLNGSNTVSVNQVAVNSSSSLYFNPGGLAMNANGQIAIAWWSSPSNPPTLPISQIYLREFNNGGSALCSLPVLAAAASGSTTPGGFAMTVDGNGVTHVVYSMYTPNYSVPYTNVPQTIYYRRFSSNCTALGAAVQVNTAASYDAEALRVAADSLGNVVVGWEYYNATSKGYDTYVQRYSTSGTAVGSNMRINNPSLNANMAPPLALALGVMDGGAFVAVYGEPRPGHPSNTSQALNWDTTVSEFSASGALIGRPFIVSNISYGAFNPSLAMDPGGDYWVGWTQVATTSNSVWAVRCKHPSQPAITSLSNGVSISGLSGAQGSMSYYEIAVPSGVSTLNLSLTGSANAAMYSRLGGLPTTTLYDIKQPGTSGTVTASIVNPPVGNYFIGVYGSGSASYSGVSLKASY